MYSQNKKVDVFRQLFYFAQYSYLFTQFNQQPELLAVIPFLNAANTSAPFVI